MTRFYSTSGQWLDWNVSLPSAWIHDFSRVCALPWCVAVDSIISELGLEGELAGSYLCGQRGISRNISFTIRYYTFLARVLLCMEKQLSMEQLHTKLVIIRIIVATTESPMVSHPQLNIIWQCTHSHPRMWEQPPQPLGPATTSKLLQPHL